LSCEWPGEPLDIEFAPWTRDPQERYLGGNEMMARFGEQYRPGPTMPMATAGSYVLRVIMRPLMRAATGGT
jgi:hypothetical protein